jgi:hypothetical protein
MDYPFEIYFVDNGTDEAPGAIRLTVAAIIACLDAGVVDGVTFSEADIAPYIQTEKFKQEASAYQDASEWDVWRRSHTFFNIKPNGTIATAVGKVTKALTDSILRNQLPTIALKANLDGSIDCDETWIRTKPFRKWAFERGLEMGDLFSKYIENENEIFFAALEGGNSFRQRMEDHEVEPVAKVEAETILNRFSGELMKGSPARDYFESLILENSYLRARSSEQQNAERPLRTTERKTLLTIIAALCVEAKIPSNKPAKAAGMIQSTAAKMGVSIGETTIEGHLNKIPDALGTRMK